MPIHTNRKSLRARLNGVFGKKTHRDQVSGAKMDGPTECMATASEGSGPEGHQEREVPVDTGINICYTGSASDNGRPQTYQDQELPGEVHIMTPGDRSAPEVKEPQACQKPKVAADFNVDTGDSVDSGYVGSESAIQPPKPLKWLNPELSTGRLILTVEGHHFWEAKGPALEVFGELQPLISRYLRAHMGAISGALFCVFMTGRTADIARPTIVFYFRDISRRKDARIIRDAVRKSGILDRYPGFKTGHSSRPKDYAALFPHENFTWPQSPSLDLMSETGTSTLTSASLPEVQVEHTWEEILIPSSNSSQESLPNETDYAPEETVPKLVRLTRWITDIIWPSPDGSERLWYLCGCGRYTYIDVKQLEAGGVERVRQNIMNNAAAVRGRPNLPPSGDTPPSPPALATPPAVYSISSPTRPTLPMASTHTGASALPSLPATSALNMVAPNSAEPWDMHLLVCVGGREFQTLAKVRHVQIGYDWNDGMLLRTLLREYEEARRGKQWSISSLLPTVPGKIKNSSLAKYIRTSQIISAIRHSSAWDLWREWVPDGGLWAPLHMPSTADFVKFHVFSQAATAEPYPDQFECGQWPSSTDAYLYEPVPMRLTTLNIPLWHELRYPGPHLRHQWYNAAAKKLDGPLFDEPFPNFDSILNIVGYGIRVNERLNDVLILWWCWVAILVTGVLVVMFAHYTGDTSSAFGMGAYLVAALTVYIQLQYACWRRGSA